MLPDETHFRAPVGVQGAVGRFEQVERRAAAAAVGHNAPRRRPIQPAQNVQQRAFARSRRADDAHQLAGRDGHIQSLQGDDFQDGRLVNFDQVLTNNKWFHKNKALMTKTVRNYTATRGDSHLPTSWLRLIPLEEVTVTCIDTTVLYNSSSLNTPASCFRIEAFVFAGSFPNERIANDCCIVNILPTFTTDAYRSPACLASRSGSSQLSRAISFGMTDVIAASTKSCREELYQLADTTNAGRFFV